MAGWTYADIEQKIRNTTGRPDASMMSSATILDYVNKVYQYVIPKELKIFWGYTYHSFYTQANVDQYVGPTTAFQTLNPQVWVDGFPMEWYLSPDLFYQDYPNRLNKQTVANGDGITNSFSYAVSAYPVLPASVYVTDGTQIVKDNGVSPTGAFTTVQPTSGAVTGSIDYLTGAVSNQGFVAPPASDTNITVSYQTYLANRPCGILYYPSQALTDSTPATRNSLKIFVLRPVPDQVYLVTMQGIQIPAPFTGASTEVPFREDLGPLIAYAASLEIFSDFNQMDQYDQAMVQFLRYKDVSMQDTYEEYLYQRSVPTF